MEKAVVKGKNKEGYTFKVIYKRLPDGNVSYSIHSKGHKSSRRIMKTIFDIKASADAVKGCLEDYGNGLSGVSVTYTQG